MLFFLPLFLSQPIHMHTEGEEKATWGRMSSWRAIGCYCSFASLSRSAWISHRERLGWRGLICREFLTVIKKLVRCLFSSFTSLFILERIYWRAQEIDAQPELGEEYIRAEAVERVRMYHKQLNAHKYPAVREESRALYLSISTINIKRRMFALFFCWLLHIRDERESNPTN